MTKLRRSPASPFVRKVMVVAHELGLAALDGEDLSSPATIGQIAAGCCLGYLDFRFPGDGWRARHPRLAAWYEGFAARPSMQATAPPKS